MPELEAPELEAPELEAPELPEDPVAPLLPDADDEASP
jgi:hypothetical protein